ncbi:acetate/propionate family kinase [Candidatus Sumerlaeota bacterium]|nr:acetate/propionate family kinase [Candidatus Sumerlaeota bacterium]
MIRVLVVNVGSTSLKFKLIVFDAKDLRTPAAVPAEGRLEGIGRPKSVYKMTIEGKIEQGETSLSNYDEALKKVLGALGAAGGEGMTNLSAIGFKPVHARKVPLDAVEMDEDVLARMAEYNSVCPAHNPPVIAAVRSFRKMLPQVPCIGLFEPAFHKTLAPEVFTESVPTEWIAEFGIRKYGFHGASHRYIAERTPEYLGIPASELKIVSCHLGGSSSITAIRDGKSVETTMSFSAQSGVPQGTRCGNIDPFIPIFLMKEKGWSLDQTAEALAKKSGLLGMSGVSAEFREIEEAAKSGNSRAARAIEVYVYQVQCGIAQMTVALEGMDTLVFTGGIGERGIETRAKICSRLRHLGVELDTAKNAAANGIEAAIQSAHSRVRILVLPTNEELIIAREAAMIVAARI